MIYHAAWLVQRHMAAGQLLRGHHGPVALSSYWVAACVKRCGHAPTSRPGRRWRYTCRTLCHMAAPFDSASCRPLLVHGMFQCGLRALPNGLFAPLT